ncbi:MAG: hypothetical protein EBX50_22635 [Chitinophagia bacterium]|nr:hypothetical protein [Chitinophagia bacterium]
MLLDFKHLSFVNLLPVCLLSILIASCNNCSTLPQNRSDTISSQAMPSTQDTADHWSSLGVRITHDTNEDHSIVYTVITDTGTDYYPLMRSMYSLSAQLKIPVDTMHRYYDEKSRKIILPENDEDELYRGDYYPRRFPGVNLSLEYYSLYGGGTDSTIALVAGLFETQREADSLAGVIKLIARRSFVTKSYMYIGCLH